MFLGAIDCVVVAMNARIVAARAGAAGNEFAVVATELIAITTDIETILKPPWPSRCKFSRVLTQRTNVDRVKGVALDVLQGR